MNDSATIHPTAIIEDGVHIGPDTCVWDNVHIREGASIGRGCIVGEKSYIAYGVRVGDLCKINASVYICAGVSIQDGVMISAHTVFTNDPLPRATDPDLVRLRSSDPNEHTKSTTVHRGVTIGANCTIGPGLRLGEWCMVGMGSVVTRDVPSHALVVGNPAKIAGAVCACGNVVARVTPDGELPTGPHACTCGRSVSVG